MREPRRTLETEIHKCVKFLNCMCNLYPEERVVDFDTSTNRSEPPYTPLMKLYEAKLPEGIDLKSCYIAGYIQGDCLVLRLMHNQTSNPDYDEQLKRYEEWKTESRTKSIQKAEEELERAKENLKYWENHLEIIRKHFGPG